MPRAPITQKKTSPQYLLVPTTLRKSFDRVSVCVDVTFTKTGLATLAGLCETQAQEFYFAGSSRDDQEMGLLAQALEPGSTKLHITIEFQKGNRSPFRKLDAKDMTKILSVIGKGKGMALRHAEYSFTPENAGLPFPEPVTIASGARLRMTGMQFEVIPEADNDPQKGMSIRQKRDGSVRATYWLRSDKAVGSLDESIDLASKEVLDQAKKS